MKAIIAVIVAALLIALGVDARLTSTASLVRNVTGGLIQGYQEPFMDTYTFKGVPFAAPPTGANRFMTTAPVNSWTGIKDTMNFSAGCMQHCILPSKAQTCPPVLSEDCLYLNIWTPEIMPEEPLPVLIFIHGGAYVQGAAGVPLYDGAGVAKNQNVVFVSGNYRLGLFGSMYTDTVNGNFMLDDQRQLMRWVKANIAQFGGNPDHVTISGQSAGAMSVGAHMVAPASEGLFNAAIMDSNPYGLLFADTKLGLQLGDAALKKLNCKGTTGTAQVECLQALTAEQILVVSNDTRNFPFPNSALATMVPWTPTVGTRLNDVPIQPIYLKDSKVPVMMGTMSNDSVPFINDLSMKPVSNVELDVMLGYIFGIGKAIDIKKLFGEPSDKKDTRIYFSHIGTDYMFYCPNRMVARQFSKTQPVFKYVFSHLPSFSTWMWGQVDPLCDNHVCHADDLPFMFNNAYAIPRAPKPTAEEEILMQYEQDVWGNFAKYYNPNGPAGNQTLYPAFGQFKSATDTTQNYLVPRSTTMTNYQEKFCDYFDSIGYDRH